MTTLVFHHGALGDGVLIWPLLRAWSPCVLVGRASRAALAARWIDGLRWLDADGADAAALFGEGSSLDDNTPLGCALAQSQRIISFVSDGQDVWAANAARLAPQASIAFVRARPGGQSTMHVTEFHQLQLHASGIAVEPAAPALRDNRDGPVIIHPGSGGVDKCWPVQMFEALLDHLALIGREAWVVLGEAELERWPRGTLQSWRSRYEVHVPEDLISLSELIARAGVFVGNDAGPTHLAAQLGVPTLALFGPTDPHTWQPVGPRVRVIAPPQPCAMDWLLAEPVIELIARLG